MLWIAPPAAEPIVELRSSSVEKILSELAARAAVPVAHTFDLSGLRRVERRAAAILGSYLAGLEPAARWSVRAPVRDGPRSLLLHGGVGFAIAQAKALRWESENSEQQLLPWRQTWLPARSATVGTQIDIFSPEQAGESFESPNVEQQDYVAFVNPHRSLSPRRELTLSSVVRPWLLRLLRSPFDRAPEDIGVFTDELLSNVREHAPLTSSGRASTSLVYLTRSRGSKTDRLYLVTLDTGTGIATTLRPKLGLSDGRVSDAQLLKEAVLGTHRGWHRVRGFGLPEIWSRVEAWPDSQLDIFTRRLRLRGSHGRLEVTTEELDLPGTTIIIGIPLST